MCGLNKLLSNKFGISNNSSVSLMPGKDFAIKADKVGPFHTGTNWRARYTTGPSQWRGLPLSAASWRTREIHDQLKVWTPTPDLILFLSFSRLTTWQIVTQGTKTMKEAYLGYVFNKKSIIVMIVFNISFFCHIIHIYWEYIWCL